jgi:hypothetical protein
MRHTQTDIEPVLRLLYPKYRGLNGYLEDAAGFSVYRVSLNGPLSI